MIYMIFWNVLYDVSLMSQFYIILQHNHHAATYKSYLLSIVICITNLKWISMRIKTYHLGVQIGSIIKAIVGGGGYLSTVCLVGSGGLLWEKGKIMHKLNQINISVVLLVRFVGRLGVAIINEFKKNSKRKNTSSSVINSFSFIYRRRLLAD